MTVDFVIDRDGERWERHPIAEQMSPRPTQSLVDAIAAQEFQTDHELSSICAYTVYAEDGKGCFADELICVRVVDGWARVLALHQQGALNISDWRNGEYGDMVDRAEMTNQEVLDYIVTSNTRKRISASQMAIMAALFEQTTSIGARTAHDAQGHKGAGVGGATGVLTRYFDVSQSYINYAMVICKDGRYTDDVLQGRMELTAAHVAVKSAPLVRAVVDTLAGSDVYLPQGAIEALALMHDQAPDLFDETVRGGGLVTSAIDVDVSDFVAIKDIRLRDVDTRIESNRRASIAIRIQANTPPPITLTHDHLLVDGLRIVLDVDTMAAIRNRIQTGSLVQIEIKGVKL